jgi:hypothetical protein
MATDQERTETAGGGLSRRQVLARGAVAAGVVWAAPVIRTASAYATSAAGTERPCTRFYLVCLDPLGPRPVRFLDPEQGYDEMPSDSTLARYRPNREPTTTTTASTTTSSTSSTTTSSTSSTTTSSTTSTSTTTTTTAPSRFDDPTEGIGLFPGDEAGADPRQKKKPKKKPKKDKSKKDPEANAAEQDALAEAAGLGAPDPNDPPAPDELGLFPEATDPAAAAAANTPVPDELPPGIEQWLEDNPDVPVRYPEIPPMLTQTGDQAWAVLLPEVVEGPNPATHQCRAVKGWAQSGDRHGEFYVDANPGLADEEGRRLIFPNPTANDAKPALIDKVYLVYCCPR